MQRKRNLRLVDNRGNMREIQWAMALKTKRPEPRNAGNF